MSQNLKLVISGLGDKINMNIGFDAKRLFLNNTGLGNYSRYMVDTLLKYQPNEQYFLYTPKVKLNNRTEHYFNHSAISIIQPNKLMQLPLMNAWWRSAGVVHHPSFSTLDIYHGLSHELPMNIPSYIKKFVTIHDLIFYRYPEFYQPIDVFTYKQKVKSACLRADKIIAISEQTASDITTFLKIPAEKISVVYQGCHDQFRNISTIEERNSVKIKYGLPEKYLLNVSTVEKRKNTLSLVKAMAKIPRTQRIPLLIVGRHTKYFSEVNAFVQSAGLTDDVLFIDKVEFSELPAIYQMASAFIYPSLFEGFGIPLIEAAESGIPIITSTGSCFKEAAGKDALFIDPLNFNELASAIIEILHTDQSERIRKQKEHARKFWPMHSANEIVTVYES